MGKKAKKSPSSTVELNEADAQQVQQFKEDGNKLFGRKEYLKAMDSYDKALKVVGDGHADSALLYSNKAACNMMLKRFKESINDCTSALDAQPGYFKALVRRARAYESLGLYKQALADAKEANKTDQASPETQESEKRLRDILGGKKTVANGVGKRAVGKSARLQPMLFIQAKVTLENETRLIHMTNTITYAELLDAVHKKFPDCGPVVLKYLDREGDLVTVTDKADLQKAMAELVEQAGINGPHGPKLPPPGLLPPLRIQLQKVGSEDEVPKPPAEEERLLMTHKALAAQAAQQQKQQQKEEGEVYELDEWLVEFAQLFREMLNIDPDKHIELHNLGYEKCTQALEAAVQSEEALPLFGKAAERFQEVTANGLLNWGNVYMCVARKCTDEAAIKGQEATQVAEKVEAEFKKAEQRYNESLQYKSDYYDSFIALGQLFSERAKLVAGFILAQPKPSSESGQDPKEAEAKNMDAQLAATAAALAKLKKDDVMKANEWFDKAIAMFQKAMEALPAEEAEKEIKPMENKQEGQEEEISLKAHTLVVWGNLLYEISQVRAAVGDAWKEVLDEAVAKFREAGCNEADIRGALLNHSKKDEIDIPPEPEKPAEKPVEKPVESSEPEKDNVKGLPALPKPKKKVDA